MTSRKINVKADGGAELYLHTNADENAEVQLVYSTSRASLFLDFTLKEAKQFRKQLDAAITDETKRQARRK